MKRIVTTLFAFALSSTAMANAFVLQVNQDDQNVELRFETTREFSSMCGLEVESVLLRKGSIAIEAKHNPDTMCMMAFGPHRGAINLQLGYGLPQLEDGQYQIVINGKGEGRLVVYKGTAELALKHDFHR